MASRFTRHVLAALAIAATFSFARPAAADPTPQQKELARSLMQKGREAREAHDLKLAFESFKAADDIMHVVTTGFEVARSQADLGQLVEAHETLLRVLRIPEAPDESKAFKDARGYAKVLDDELLSRIPQLQITVEGGTATSVTVDGVTIPPAALMVPFKVDPGHHVLVAKSDAGEGRAEVDIKERETKPVKIKLAGGSAPAPAPSPAPAPAPAPAPEPAPAPAPASSPMRFTTLTWIGFGVGAAGLLAGGVTGVMALSDKSSLDSQCNGTRCPTSAHDSLSSAQTMATVSTISFIVAGVGAGVGVGSLLFGKPATVEATTGSRVRVTPWIGVGSVGAVGTF